MLRTFTAGQPANHLAVATAIRRLRGHHSRSTLPVRARALLAQRRNTYTMTTSPRPQPWKCSVCKQNVRAQALFCGQCGGHWESVAVAPTPIQCQHIIPGNARLPHGDHRVRTTVGSHPDDTIDRLAGGKSRAKANHRKVPTRAREKPRARPRASPRRLPQRRALPFLLHQPRLQYQDQRLHRQAQRHHRRNVCSSRH